MRNCRTCTNTILMSIDGIIKYKVDCKCLHKLTNEEISLYFKKEQNGCPYWEKSEFAGDKIKEYIR